MKKFLLLCLALIAVVSISAQTKDLTLKGTTPSDGSNYSFSSNDGSVTFQFSRQVTVEEGWIIPAKGEKIAITDMFGSGAGGDMDFIWYCSIRSQMLKLVNAGTIKVGEMFQVQLKGVKESVEPFGQYGTDGIIAISLKAVRAPGTFVGSSVENGGTINTFYKEGDPEGSIVFNFSEDVVCENVDMSYGNPEEGTYGKKDVPFRVSGSVITVDLQGINMEPKELNGQKDISLRLLDVETLDGELIEGNLPGSPGWVYLHLNLKKAQIELPYGGFECENIDKAESVDCWLSESLLFDAVRFSFTLKGKPAIIDIPAGKTTIISDPETEGAVIIKAPMKDLAFDAGTVTVELVNARTEDQDMVEVSNDFVSGGRTADKVVCFGVNPGEGVIMKFPQIITFSFNDAVTFEKGEILIGEEEIIPLSFQVKVENNVLTINNVRGEFSGDIKIKLNVKDSEGNYITFGSEDGYVTVNYNIPVDTYKCIAVIPEAGTKVESLESFSLTFEDASNPVEQIGGFDPAKKVYVVNEKGEKIEGVVELDATERTVAVVKLASKITEAGRYTLVIPEATVYNSYFDDMQDDFGVSMGAKYNPEFIARYTIGDVNATTCDKVTPEPGECESFPGEYTFTFSADVEVTRALMMNDFIGRPGNDILSLVTVADKVVTIKLDPKTLEECTFVSFTLEVKDLFGMPVTFGGIEGFVKAEYEKSIAANTFACTAITPAEGEVSSLKEFVLEFTNPDDERDFIGGFDTSKTIVLNDNKGTKVAEGAITTTDSFVLTAKVTLDSEIKTDGTYTLIIPEGLVYNSGFDAEADDFGVLMGAIYNPEAIFTYTVKTVGIESVIADMAGEVSVYTVQGVLIRKADVSVALKDLPRGIYIVNGRKIAIE